MAVDMNVNVLNPSFGSTQTLQGGMFNSSFTLANTTAVSLGDFLTGGTLEWGWETGNGSVSLATYTSTDNTNFYPLYIEKDDGSFVITPAIVTPTSSSAAFAVENLKSKYLKFVPTVSGTCQGTLKFTPSK